MSLDDIGERQVLLEKIEKTVQMVNLRKLSTAQIQRQLNSIGVFTPQIPHLQHLCEIISGQSLIFPRFAVVPWRNEHSQIKLGTFLYRQLKNIPYFCRITPT